MTAPKLTDSYDRAAEWVNEHHPELAGVAWDRFVAEVEADLLAIDDAADAVEGQMRRVPV